MASPDLDRIVGNITELISAGAKSPDISKYIQSEGITAEQLGAKDQASFDQQIDAASSQSQFQENLKTSSAIPGKVGEFITEEVAPLLPSTETIEAAAKITPDIAKKSALPVIGGIVGGAIGLKLGGVRGAVAGESFGSAGGEILNQFFGITEESLIQIALEAVAPPVTRGAAGLLKAGKRVLTPRASAELLNELAGPESAKLLNKLQPSTKASALFELADREISGVNLTQTIETLTAEIPKLKALSTPPTSLAPMRRLLKRLERTGGQLTPSELQGELELFGDMIKALEKKGGTKLGKLKQTFKSMVADLDTASDISGAETLLLARDSYKRGKSVDALSGFIDDATRSLRGQGEVVQFNAQTVLNRLKKDPFFSKAFTDVEQKEIRELLGKLNKIPALRPGGGQNKGSFRLITETMFGAAGMDVGFRAAGVPGAAIGATAAFIPAALDISRNISMALQMDAGRELLKSLIVKGTLDSRGAAILSIFVATQFANAPQDPSR